MRRFSTIKELYQKIIQTISQIKDFGDPNNFGACNMRSQEVAIAAACALGQLEAHVGNFGDAEEILTTTLKEMEEHFGPQHPKIGVILTCIALMYRLKSTVERSSSLLILEGLLRKAIELLKAPSLEVDGADGNVNRKDIIALARETLLVQQSRKAEGERLKHWAETGGCHWGKHWSCRNRSQRCQS
ncbi:Tetratricopeptide repeat superfamily protein [Perilla frutescens var. hirtella]|uniref:Tetratricopeptide repeat superfamily protein n=1 Tax=Perilla frutescens var. hirtella TaxID=608512 RepID=A0AAD4NW74_PERFH|nr:Tetratricopeptide repeat superfamily protein [Perilla frutescens var. hirtella]